MQLSNDNDNFSNNLKGFQKCQHEKPIKVFKCFPFTVIGRCGFAEAYGSCDWLLVCVSSRVFARFPSVEGYSRALQRRAKVAFRSYECLARVAERVPFTAIQGRWCEFILFLNIVFFYNMFFRFIRRRNFFCRGLEIMNLIVNRITCLPFFFSSYVSGQIKNIILIIKSRAILKRLRSLFLFICLNFRVDHRWPSFIFRRSLTLISRTLYFKIIVTRF